jgi:hypothetical protein
MMIEPFHIRQSPPAVFWWCGMFAPKTDRIDTPWHQGETGFEADIAFPVGDEVVHILEPLATVELQVAQQDVAGLYAAAAVLLTVDMKTVQMLITPGEHDLQDGVEMRQCGVAMDEQAAPDEGADAS